MLGENGAGKTTLLSVLAGHLRPDGGTVEVAGRPAAFRSPREAWRAGIGMVHQHFALVPAFTALENLALGFRSSRRGFALPLDALRNRAAELQRRTGLSVALDAPAEELGVGGRQRLAILRTLLRGPSVLVLDEPTAVLTPKEVERLFVMLRELAGTGVAIVLVAHKLDEILSVTDRVTVLRRGRSVLEAGTSDVDANVLARAMVGGEVRDAAALGSMDLALEVAAESPRRPRPPARAPGPRLRSAEAPGAHVRPSRARVPAPWVAGVRDALVLRGGVRVLDGVTLEIRRGEIVGVAGVEGNGQRELARLLAGRLAPDEGVVDLPGGVGFIPQDRTREGLITSFDLAENVALSVHDDPSFRSGPFLRWDRVRARAEALRQRYGIVAPDVRARAAALSGGNQQRLIVGRELARASDLLVAENPTRGLDVAATAFVHEELRRRAEHPRRAAGGGSGVVLISTDLDEVLALSDRIFVIVRGRLTAVPPAEHTREGVGAWMLSGGGGRGDG